MIQTGANRSVAARARWRRGGLLRLEWLESRIQPGSLLLAGGSLDALDLTVPPADAGSGADAALLLLSAYALSAAAVGGAGVAAAGPIPSAAESPPRAGKAAVGAASSGLADLDLGIAASAPASTLTVAPATGPLTGGALVGTAAAAAPVAPIATVPVTGPVVAPRGTAAASAPTSPLGSPLSPSPFSFEANQGQTDARVQFLAHGAGYTLFLTSTAAVFRLPLPAGKAEALRMDLVGANPAAAVAGQDPLPGQINYLVGNDPAQWHVHIPSFSQVAYQGIYPGIDLVYYGNQGQLEYDFVVHPGADPHAVRLGFEGADQVSLDGQGSLVLATPAGPLVQPAPVVYQEVNGVRHAVAGRFLLDGAGQVGFALGSYDPTQPLVIDPVVVTYSTYLGGSRSDTGRRIAVDAAGHAYVTGTTESPDFPTTPGAFQTSPLTSGGFAFVSELTADGSGLVYSTYLGGHAGFYSDEGAGIAVDAAGHAYVTGFTSSRDFPITPGAFQATLGTPYGNAFVTELTPDGSGLVYSTYLGGSGHSLDGDNGFAIAVDAAGHAYVTGGTASSDFPTTPGAVQTTPGGGEDGFVTELTADGTGLVYSTYLGGTAYDVGYAVAVNAAGSAYIVGNTASSDFPITPGAFQTTLRGTEDAFVTELTPDGARLVYSTYVGSSGTAFGNGLAIDAAGHAYVTGGTNASDFPTTPGAFQSTLGNSFEGAFVTELTVDGRGLVYSTFLSGNGRTGEVGDGIAVDAAGNAYVAGATSSGNFPTTPDAIQTTNHGIQNAFVTVFTATGSSLAYSTYIGGSRNDVGTSLALAADGSVYVAGQTSSRNFPTTRGAFQRTDPASVMAGWVASGRLM